MSKAVFRLDLLKNYQVVDKPGTFIVSVAYDVTDTNLYTKDEYPRYIVPLRVITPDNLIKLIRVLNNATEIPYTNVSKYFTNGSLFVKPESDLSSITLPTKGEKIVATFDYKDEKLYCTHLKLIDREELNYVNLSRMSSFYENIKELLDE